MGVRIRSSGLRLDKSVLVDKALMREIGDLAVEEIVSRTEGGVDSDGKPFKPYSEDYAKKKATYRGIGTGTVNLRGMGPGVKMLDTIGVVAVTDNSVTIGLKTARSQELALYHDQLGAGKSRVVHRFFDVSKGFMDRAARLIRKRWRK